MGKRFDKRGAHITMRQGSRSVWRLCSDCRAAQRHLGGKGVLVSRLSTDKSGTEVGKAGNIDELDPITLVSELRLRGVEASLNPAPGAAAGYLGDARDPQRDDMGGYDSPHIAALREELREFSCGGDMVRLISREIFDDVRAAHRPAFEGNTQIFAAPVPSVDAAEAMGPLEAALWAREEAMHTYTELVESASTPLLLSHPPFSRTRLGEEDGTFQPLWPTLEDFIEETKDYHFMVRSPKEIAIRGGGSRAGDNQGFRVPGAFLPGVLSTEFDTMVGFNVIRDPLYHHLRRCVGELECLGLADRSLQPTVSVVGGVGRSIPFFRTEESWATLLFGGRKLWCLVDPHTPPRSAHRPQFLSTSLEEPNCCVLVQNPGETVVVPRGWWRATYNLPGDALDDPAVAVALGGVGGSPHLHYDVAEGRTQALLSALEEEAMATARPVSAVIRTQVGTHGRSLLHTAATVGNGKMVQLLVARGADLNAVDDLGMTPLHWAVERRKDRCAIALVEAGADLHVQRFDGQTAADLAKKTRANKVRRLIQEKERIQMVW